MMLPRLSIAAAATACAIALAWPAAAQETAQLSWRDFAGVRNTSYVEPSGARAIQLSIDVPAPAPRVFAAFATVEGFQAWAVPFARIELRVDGKIESSYDAAAQPGAPDNIRNRILAYIPDRLLVIRNVQAPAALAGREAFAKTVTVIAFDPIDTASTRVTVTNAGYGQGAEFDAAYRHFEWGNAYTLAEQREHFTQ